MALVPKAIRQRIQFYKTLVPQWEQHAEQIGVTPEMIADLDAKTQDAMDAFNEQSMAQMRAMTATEKLAVAIDKMGTAGAGIIAYIRATAHTKGSSVYSLAQIPAPAARSRKPEPGKPYNLDYNLLGGGSLKLNWKCDNPKGTTGTVYQIMRKVDGGEFDFLDTAGQKEYVDDTLPMGTKQILYKIRARRGKTIGTWAVFIISIGTMNNGVSVLGPLANQKAA